MFGIPYQRITINSSLSPIAVSQCLQDIVWEDASIFWRRKIPADKRFVGKCSFDSSKIQKIGIVPKSPHNPTLYGKFRSVSNGSKIEITITLDVISFFIVLLVNIALLFIGVVGIDRMTSIAPIVVILGIIGVFNYVGYWVFKLEAEDMEFEIRRKLSSTDLDKDVFELNA